MSILILQKQNPQVLTGKLECHVVKTSSDVNGAHKAIKSFTFDTNLCYYV